MKTRQHQARGVRQDGATDRVPNNHREAAGARVTDRDQSPDDTTSTGAAEAATSRTNTTREAVTKKGKKITTTSTRRNRETTKTSEKRERIKWKPQRRTKQSLRMIQTGVDRHHHPDLKQAHNPNDNYRRLISAKYWLTTTRNHHVFGRRSQDRTREQKQW